MHNIAQLFSKHGLHFKAGAIKWKDCILCTVSDASASRSNEQQIVKGKLEPYRSQRARMTLLVDKKFGTETFYPIVWSSTIKRVCRSTLQAESYPMTSGAEEGLKIRAMIADCCNQLDLRRWEESSRTYMKQIITRTSLLSYVGKDLGQTIVCRSGSTTSEDLGKGW